jgi:hypothetical protein
MKKEINLNHIENVLRQEEQKLKEIEELYNYVVNTLAKYLMKKKRLII